MSNKARIIILRIGFWVGAILDALNVIVMLFPTIGGAMMGLENFNPSIEYKYAMGLGASLMTGWTFLLIWADRKPLERRFIALLTVFPVIIGIAVSNILVISTGFINFVNMIPLFAIQIILTILFISGFILTRNIGKD